MPLPITFPVTFPLPLRVTPTAAAYTHAPPRFSTYLPTHPTLACGGSIQTPHHPRARVPLLARVPPPVSPSRLASCRGLAAASRKTTTPRPPRKTGCHRPCRAAPIAIGTLRPRWMGARVASCVIATLGLWGGMGGGCRGGGSLGGLAGPSRAGMGGQGGTGTCRRGRAACRDAAEGSRGHPVWRGERGGGVFLDI